MRSETLPDPRHMLTSIELGNVSQMKFDSFPTHSSIQREHQEIAHTPIMLRSAQSDDQTDRRLGGRPLTPSNFPYMY